MKFEAADEWIGVMGGANLLRRRQWIAATGAAFLTSLFLTPVLLVGVADASGTYMGRPTRPPSSIDRADYELGKKVFTGEFIERAGTASAEQQRSELEDLQSRLPRRARERAAVDLTELAGRLTDDQMRGLRHYLSRRFKVR